MLSLDVANCFHEGLRGPTALHLAPNKLREVSPKSRHRWETTWVLNTKIGHVGMTLSKWTLKNLFRNLKV